MLKRYLNSLLFFCFDCKPDKLAAIKEIGPLDPAQVAG
jgi:hypothetical protein